jgi:hypothetical protein
VFCQADKVVDDAVDIEKDLKPSIDWLNKHVNADGSVTDNMPEKPREMMVRSNVHIFLYLVYNYSEVIRLITTYFKLNINIKGVFINCSILFYLFSQI